MRTDRQHDRTGKTRALLTSFLPYSTENPRQFEIGGGFFGKQPLYFTLQLKYAKSLSFPSVHFGYTAEEGIYRAHHLQTEYGIGSYVDTARKHIRDTLSNQTLRFDRTPHPQYSENYTNKIADLRFLRLRVSVRRASLTSIPPL